MKALKLAAALAAAVFVAASATAASAAITYTLSGDATGAVLDTSYNIITTFSSQAAEFDFNGDFGGSVPPVNGAHLTGGTVSAFGLTADIDFATDGAFGVVPFAGIAAFGTPDQIFNGSGVPPIVFGGLGLLGYSGFSSLAPTPVQVLGPDGTDGFRLFNITFSGQPLILEVDDFANATFSASGSVPTGGVPEPAAWALMILGFGAAGAMLRKRRALALI